MTRLRRRHPDVRVEKPSLKHQDELSNALKRCFYLAGPPDRRAARTTTAPPIPLVSGVELQQAELETLCSKAADNSPSNFHITCVGLRESCWAGAVNIMR